MKKNFSIFLILMFLIIVLGLALKAEVLPYNYRVIDELIHAGGHPFNPANSFSNTDEQVLEILNYLKSQNILVVIDLENTKRIQARYQKLLDQAGIRRIHIPLNAVKVPTKKEWEEIKEAMKQPVYIHCAWGADRTGMVLARYLVENKGYTPDEAYNAVITGGTSAGPLGGFKTL
ncbi:MAG: dual specificity protein phosphatase family protein, partial [Candidatus Margulisiibacteriota bacterium]